MQSGFNEAELRRLYADAAAAPSVVKEELGRGIRAAGEKVKAAVQRGFSWSSRIPELVHLSVQESAGRPRAQITVDDPKGEAAAINNKDRPGTFKHPVFADSRGERDVRTRAARRRIKQRKKEGVTGIRDWVWVEQPARPSFRTNAVPAAIEAETDITDAMDRAARRLGFH